MKRILITDNDPGIQDIFKIILGKAGYHVSVLSNGAPIMKNNYERPDLFLIDKQLSGVDGLDICKYLKSRDETKEIPVIIVSASPDLDKLSADAGADAFLEKPFMIKDLLRLVEYFIRIERVYPQSHYVRSPAHTIENF
jgi:DNA-binding response OmpR family regulator